MADLQKLHDEALHAITLARQAYDRAMGAYRCAPKGSDEQGRMTDLLHALSDVVNATQATLYSATQAMKDAHGVKCRYTDQPGGACWRQGVAVEQCTCQRMTPEQIDAAAQQHDASGVDSSEVKHG